MAKSTENSATECNTCCMYWPCHFLSTFFCFTGSGPSYDHEMARFKLANNIQELWFYTKSQLKKLNTDAANKVLDDIGHRHRFVFVFSSLPHKFSSSLRQKKNHTLGPCHGRHFISNFLIYSIWAMRQEKDFQFIWCNPHETGRCFILKCQNSM